MTDWASAMEQQLLDAALALAPREGWTSRTARLAGEACGLTQGETELLIPQGPADLAALLGRRHDAAALAVLAEVDPKSLKIRERIARAVAARLDAALADGEAEKRLTGFLALPHNLALAGRLAWESADVLWRWAGDTALDENHYSKRAILAGVLTGALAVGLASGREAALAFVSRRIDDVMAFETWKATTRLKPSRFAQSLAQALSRLRYGTRPSA